MMRAARNSRPDGFALIEALIAALLLSLGVLGIVGLQAATVKDYRDSKMRQYATIVTTDLADRIRANRAGIENYSTSNFAAPADNVCAASIASPCTPFELALDDLYHWKASLNALGFDASRVSINVNNAVSPATVEVNVVWESRTGSSELTLRTEVL